MALDYVLLELLSVGFANIKEFHIYPQQIKSDAAGR